MRGSGRSRPGEGRTGQRGGSRADGARPGAVALGGHGSSLTRTHALGPTERLAGAIEFVSGRCHQCHRYRNRRNQPNSLDPSQVSPPVGASLELCRQRAEGPLPDGLCRLVHGAILTSIPANMGVHEIEEGSVSAVRNKSRAKVSGTHRAPEHQLATEVLPLHPVLKSRLGLLLHACQNDCTQRYGQPRCRATKLAPGATTTRPTSSPQFHAALAPRSRALWEWVDQIRTSLEDIAPHRPSCAIQRQQKP